MVQIKANIIITNMILFYETMPGNEQRRKQNFPPCYISLAPCISDSDHQLFEQY